MKYLQYLPNNKGSAQRLALISFPYRIGRGPNCELVLSCKEVSKVHAEIFLSGGQVRIRDLGSTNGTYVNGYRIAEAPLANDDVIHLAQEEFLYVGQETVRDKGEDTATHRFLSESLLSIVRAGHCLDELIRLEQVRMLFQPVVDLHTGESIGHEALARGAHSELVASPRELLNLADRCGMVMPLSRLFREAGVRQAAPAAAGQFLFLNLHPSEVHHDALVDHMREIKLMAPATTKIVLEIHENVACDFAVQRGLRQKLHELGILVAYDDFGAGQARFLELAELPPDFVKLDRQLIRNIESTGPRHNLLHALVRVSLELGIKVIAEGVETPMEAEICRSLGCQYGQGYFFGLPKSPDARKKDSTLKVPARLLRDRVRRIQQASKATAN